MEEIDMKYITHRPTEEHPDLHEVSIRRRGIKEKPVRLPTLAQAIIFRDKTAPKIAAKASAKRAATRAERAANPNKFDFEALDVKTIVREFLDKLEKNVATAKSAGDNRELRTADRALSAWGSHRNTVLNNIGSVSVQGLVPSWAMAYRDKMRGATSDTGRPFSYETIHKHWKLISRAVRAKAFAMDLRPPSLPFSTKELFPKGWENKRKRLCKSDEEIAIRAAATELDHPSREQWGHVISMALDTGARLQEIALALWDEIDLDRRVWTMPSDHTKGDAERSVPLSQRATAAVLALRAVAPKGEPRVFHLLQDPRWVSNTFRQRIVGPSGVEGLRFHDLRHTAITKMLTRPDGPRLAQVMAFVGHSSAEMTERYSHLEAANFVDRMG